MKYSKLTIDKFCGLISLGNTEATAAAQTGISMETFKDWLLHKPRFARAYGKAKSDIQILLTSKLLKHAERDPRAAQCLYERVHSDYRRNNARSLAEAKQNKLTPEEHRQRMRQIFGVKEAEVIEDEPNGAQPCQDEDEDGLSIQESLDAAERAKAYGERIARRYERRELPEKHKVVNEYIQPEPDRDGEKRLT